MKKQAVTSVDDWERYRQNTGLAQANNFDTLHRICKDLVDNNDKDYTYRSIADGVSMISLEEEYSFVDGGFDDDDKDDQSMVSSVGAYGSVAGMKKKFQQKMVHGSSKVGWDYIIDKWKYPEQHLSLQVRLLSGLNINSQLIYCVSTNQDKYVLSLPYSYNL